MDPKMSSDANDTPDMLTGQEEETAKVAETSPCRAMTPNSPNRHQEDQLLQHKESTNEQTSKQDRENSIEQANLKARRHSNRRFAQNARSRQTNVIESLEAENKCLQVELRKALDQIDQIRITLEQETQRVIDHNRCLQLISDRHVKKQLSAEFHKEPLRSSISGRSAGSTETAHCNLHQMLLNIVSPF
jgi:hypothetical protein